MPAQPLVPPSHQPLHQLSQHQQPQSQVHLVGATSTAAQVTNLWPSSTPIFPHMGQVFNGLVEFSYLNFFLIVL